MLAIRVVNNRFPPYEVDKAINREKGAINREKGEVFQIVG